MGIETWGRVNSNLKWLTKAYNNPYFDLKAYCIEKGLNYEEVIGFIKVGNSICSGEVDCTYEIKKYLKQNSRLIIALETILN